MTLLAEYIWIDGGRPTASLRSKTKVLRRFVGDDSSVDPSDLPVWSADGSRTFQATSDGSDIALKPVRVAPDPFRDGGLLVLCEVLDRHGEAHPTNARAQLRDALERGASEDLPLFGFEQEYTLMRADGTPLVFPEGAQSALEGAYYCGVGTAAVRGRAVYEAFLVKCILADLPLSGVSWEVMPGRAEVQIVGDALEAADGIWLARYILQRTAEEFGVVASFESNAGQGDRNGAAMHTNFSTRGMRGSNGLDVIFEAVASMAERWTEHLVAYGDAAPRLVGAHETRAGQKLRWGVENRGASIRIPQHVFEARSGHLEDRRPRANADPYRVAARMVETICLDDVSPSNRGSMMDEGTSEGRAQ